MGSDNDDPLDRLAERVRGGKKKAKVSKASRTLFLREPDFKIFKEYCAIKGFVASDVIDEMIYTFLMKVKDDLPAHLDVPTRDEDS
jgi:hypothetical protein